MALAKNDTERISRFWRWRMRNRNQFIVGSALGY